MTSALPEGRILSLCDSQGCGLDYFAYLPTGASAASPVIASLHGYTRNAAEHAFHLSPQAEARGCVLVVPLFTRERFARYQQLGPDAAGVTPEAAFDGILRDASVRFGLDVARIDAFGYSGGGQFLHRYLMRRPGRVRRAALFAPGWYTWPDPALPFPYGLGNSAALNGRLLHAEGLAGSEIGLFVGGRDVQRDASLNKRARIDRLQGRNRLERARRWTAALQASPLVEASADLIVLEDAGHDFSRNILNHAIAPAVFNWLTASRPAGLPVPNCNPVQTGEMT